MKKFALYFLFMILLHQNGCGIFIKINKDNGIFIPAGIDSLTAVVSDSITNRLFVSESKKSKALNLLYKAKKHYQIADSLYLILTSLKPNSCDSLGDKEKCKKDVLTDIIFERICKAENDLIKAKKLNPFELNIRDQLADVYFLHGALSIDPKYHNKSIQELKEIISREKCNHVLYYRLGENYSKLKDWKQAFNNYKHAENVLLETAFLNKGKNWKKRRNWMVKNDNVNVVTDSVDSEIHFRYVYFQAKAAAKLYKTESALSLFQKAQQIAPDQNKLELVKNYTKWIKWDGGNIAASEKKITLLKYLSEKKYKQAKAGFVELIEELNTQKAKDEIGWQIALIEYEFLDQKEEGCQRLYKIVRDTPVNQITGMPLDPDYEKYFRDCGTMFFKLGLMCRKESKYKNAFKCFENASKIQWYGKWKSLLEIAKLTVHDPEKTLIIIDQILNSKHTLDKTEQLNALTLKLNALKRFGKNRIEETKDTYLKIRSIQSKIN